MITFWIIVLSLGLLSVLVPPFLEFVVGIVLWPLAIIISPFVILTNRIKAKQGIKGKNAEEERELRKSRTKVFGNYMLVILFPALVIEIILLFCLVKPGNVLLSYPTWKYYGILIGLPTVISAIISWLILILYRRDV